MLQKYADLLLPGILGILFHVFVIKIQSAKVRSKAANIEFSFPQYIKDEWAVLLGNFICVCMLVVGIDELIGLKPGLAKAVKWLFFFVGISGSSIFMYAFSVADKKIRNVVDIKTNLADGVIPPVTPENKEGVEVIKDQNKPE
jgi:hypothetical protein